MPLTKATQNVISPNICTTDTNQSITGQKTFSTDCLINGLTIGKGLASVASNTSIGVNALSSNTTGLQNTAIGSFSLQLNDSGLNNTSVGRLSLQNNTSGSYNTAIGQGTNSYNTTGNYNTSLGVGCNGLNTLGGNNTAVGALSLYNNTSSSNTAVGTQALYSNTTGFQNSALGQTALSNNTTFQNGTGIGFNSQITGSNQVQLGNSSTTTYAYGAVQDRSDIRDKADIRDTILGLDFINSLHPVDFKWDIREDYKPEEPIKPDENASQFEKDQYEIDFSKWLENVKLSNISHDGSKKRNRYHHGLIAQEVKSVIESKGIDFGGFQDHSINGGDDVMSIGYEELIAPLIKAVQELSAKVSELEAK